jgi:predicted transcriptional regulator
MAKRSSKPTAGEVEILQALWALGPSTVRQVQEHLGGRTGYTTVLKLMQIMSEKGLLARDQKEKTHVFWPSQPQQKTQRHLASDLIDRAFGGSARKLIIAALSARPTSEDDLQQIRNLLDEQQKRRSQLGKRGGAQ